jgi:hypothetical protein
MLYVLDGIVLVTLTAELTQFLDLFDMPDHPLEAILTTGLDVNKAALKAELKNYARDWLDVVTFRTYDLPGVIIAVIDGQLYEYDPLDLITADNGTTCIHDASARRFKRQSAATAGSTLFRASAVAGTNAVTADTDGMPALSATPRLLLIEFANDNTGAMTIALDGGAAVAIQIHGAAIPTGTIIANIPYVLEVTSTSAQVILPGLTI